MEEIGTGNVTSERSKSLDEEITTDGSYKAGKRLSVQQIDEELEKDS